MKSVIVRRIGNLARAGSSLSAIVMAGLAAGVVVAPTAAFAQTATSTLRGRAPAGVEVVATETSTGSVRPHRRHGRHLCHRRPALRQLPVTAGDRSAVVAVAVASTAVLDLDAPAAEAQPGDIIVQGVRPSVDVRSSSVNQFVRCTTSRWCRRSPATSWNSRTRCRRPVQRRCHRQHLAAGRRAARLVGQRLYRWRQPEGLCGRRLGHHRQRRRAREWRSGNPFPQLAIAEYKVITSNYPAQYGDAASTIIVAQTKSGTNQFHGEAFGQFTNQDLRARTPPKRRRAATSAGAELGIWRGAGRPDHQGRRPFLRHLGA